MDSTIDIISLSSRFSVRETVDTLERVFRSKGITIYGRIDQQAEAAKAGLQIKSMELLIFGNPRAGIPLMVKVPLSGLDLPLKILAWEDPERLVWLSYNSFSYLQKRFSLPKELIDALTPIESLIRNSIGKEL